MPSINEVLPFMLWFFKMSIKSRAVGLFVLGAATAAVGMFLMIDIPVEVVSDPTAFFNADQASLYTDLLKEAINAQSIR